MLSLVVLSTAALVSAAPSIKPAGFTGGRAYNKFAQASKDANKFVKRGCDSIPDGADDDVLVKVYNVAKSRGVSEKVMLATFETCYVETHCNNLPCGDQDSIGVFQQRPSQGWGSFDDIMDITYSTTKFLDLAIETDKQFPDISAGVLSQKVQRSEYPTRYEESKDIGQKLLDKAKQLAGDDKPASPSGGGEDDDDDGDSDDEDCDDDSQPSEPSPTPSDPEDDDEDDCDDDDDDEDDENSPSTTSPGSQPTSTPTPPPPSGGGEGDEDEDEDDDEDDCDDDDDDDDAPASSPSPSENDNGPPKPTSDAPSSGSCKETYTVQAGDYCGKVANQYGISLANFYKWNTQLDKECMNLEIGQTYCVDN